MAQDERTESAHCQSSHSTVDIIIPSMDNRRFLEQCLSSLLRSHAPDGAFRVIVVNNGEPDSCDWIAYPGVTVLQPGRNLGWEGALQIGLAVSNAPFVCFLNDDTFFPPSSRNWMLDLLRLFDDPAVGAVGPTSNSAAWVQSMYAPAPSDRLVVTMLMGFCLLVRRSALDEAGGVDDSLPGDDDLDLSMRLRACGYTLVADRTVFVYHYGSVTGSRLHGAPGSTGWQGREMVNDTNRALIARHGFRAWYDTYYHQVIGEYVPPS